jgi:hypothetical protein
MTKEYQVSTSSPNLDPVYEEDMTKEYQVSTPSPNLDPVYEEGTNIEIQISVSSPVPNLVYEQETDTEFLETREIVLISSPLTSSHDSSRSRDYLPSPSLRQENSMFGEKFGHRTGNSSPVEYQDVTTDIVL